MSSSVWYVCVTLPDMVLYFYESKSLSNNVSI